jgi:hypothetical protein
MVVTCLRGMSIPVGPNFQAKACFVHDVEQAQVYLNVRDRRALPGPSGSDTRTHTSMNPKE